MREGGLRASILAAALVAAPATADEPDYAARLAEAAWDWRPGDLIFLNDLNAFDALVREAEGGRWASVGILRPSSGDPRVVYVDEADGVTEAMLVELTEARGAGDYEVYRISGATGAGLGLMTNYSLLSAYGSPYDPLMLFGNGRFYNAELPYEAALSEGHVLATPRRIAAFADRASPLAQALLAAWQDHPYCIAALSADECWREIGNIAVVTPGALLASGALERVHP